MFKDFYKNAWKKTTQEEKKKVVKNTGEWFPEQHENGIRGIEGVAEQYRENIMRKNSVLKQPKKKGNVIVDCTKCGKEFESYRGIGKYCNDCRKKAIAENKAKKQAIYRNVEVEVEGIGKVTQAERSVASKRAFRRGTDYVYELKRIANGTEPVRKPTGRPKLVEKPVEEPKEEPVAVVEQEPTTVMKTEPDYLETLQNAIGIVRVIKDTDDVKVAVDKTYELLVKYLSK